MIEQLLNKLDDQDFLKSFIENPQQALIDNNFNFGVGDLTSMLSATPELYKQFIEKLADNVDMEAFANAWSTCCGGWWNETT